VSRHPEDLDLLAVASGLRPTDDPLARHVAACGTCRARAAALSAVMPTPAPT
jgi:hypothetical protein